MEAREVIDERVAGLALPDGSRVLLAVSGGADSVALLRSFMRIAPRRNWSLRVLHVNHGLRGEQSDADEAFVRNLASSLRVDLHVALVPTEQYAREHRLSEETAAREVRYAAFAGALAAWPADVIAVAHTQDDQAETFLLHLLRGAGLHGLGGIQTTRGQFIRPLLDISRETILLALQEDRQGYRIDESNLDERHARGRLRQTVIPALKAIQKEPLPVLARTAGLLGDHADLLRLEVAVLCSTLHMPDGENGISVPRALLQSLHPALLRALLRVVVVRVRGHLTDVTADQIESIAQQLQPGVEESVSKIRLPNGVYLRLDHHTLHIFPTNPLPTVPLTDVPVHLPGSTQLPVGALECTMLEAPSGEELRRLIAVCGPNHALCDAESVGSALMATWWRAGDRMRPLGLNGSKKLQDLFVDRRVAREVRERTVIVRNERHVVWVPGVALDDRAAIVPSTRRLVHLRFRPKF